MLDDGASDVVETYLATARMGHNGAPEGAVFTTEMRDRLIDAIYAARWDHETKAGALAMVWFAGRDGILQMSLARLGRALSIAKRNTLVRIRNKVMDLLFVELRHGARGVSRSEVSMELAGEIIKAYEERTGNQGLQVTSNRGLPVEPVTSNPRLPVEGVTSNPGLQVGGNRELPVEPTGNPEIPVTGNPGLQVPCETGSRDGDLARAQAILGNIYNKSSTRTHVPAREDEPMFQDPWARFQLKAGKIVATPEARAEWVDDQDDNQLDTIEFEDALLEAAADITDYDRKSGNISAKVERCLARVRRQKRTSMKNYQRACDRKSQRDGKPKSMTREEVLRKYTAKGG